MMKYSIFLIMVLFVLSGCTTQMTQQEAYDIASKSVCMQNGTISEEGSFNENSDTWWFEMETHNGALNCNPACVVYSQNRSAEINWRCTGAIVE